MDIDAIAITIGDAIRLFIYVSDNYIWYNNFYDMVSQADLSICWEEVFCFWGYTRKINTCLLFDLMCCDILDVTSSLYKTGSTSNTRFLNSWIWFPGVQIHRFWFWVLTGSLKDPLQNKRGTFFWLHSHNKNECSVKTLPFCEKAKCYNKSKYRYNKY